MKLLLMMLAAAMVLGCGSRQAAVEDFIPGLYVRAIHQEYATGSDTVLIKHLDGNHYSLIKKAGFRRIHDGKALPYERAEEQWDGVWDAKAGVLYEQRRGKVLSFDAANGRLFIGGSEYHKVE